MTYGFLQKYIAFGDHAHEKWVEKHAKELPAGSTVLDVGAGTCRHRSLFNHCKYKAHDFSELDVKDVGKGGYGKLDYVSDILNIPVPSDSFDTILCTQVLEHVPEPILAIKEMARILKPGGILLLTAPQRSALHQAPYHYYGGYTRFWYTKFLPEAGFEVLSIEPNGGFFKNYGEAGQQFVSLLFPKEGPYRWRRWIFLPVFLVMKLGAVFQTIICYYMDYLDQDKGMTVGYHVKAKKIR